MGGTGCGAAVCSWAKTNSESQMDSDGLRWTQDAAGGLRLVDLSHGQFPLAQKAGERMS